MFKKLLLVSCVSLLVSVSGCTKAGQAPNKMGADTGKGQQKGVKPYRVLVVIGDQWKDPSSYTISMRMGESSFCDVINMLKVWGIPFDILRLDQQRLQINRFLDGVGKPRYRCIIWMADPNKLEGMSADYGSLRRAVQDYGISLIALFDYIKTPQVAKLVGVNYEGTEELSKKTQETKFLVSQEQFITKGLTGTVVADINATLIKCSVKSGAAALGTFGQYPQLVTWDMSDETKTVWIGGGHDWFRKYPAMRQLFRKSLVHTMGYGLFNDNFENAVMLVMDDIGASEHAYSLQWHYPTPTKEVLLKCLIEPLDKYGFVMVQNVTPGYANPLTRMIEVPWEREKFTDAFGNVQDYASTKAGLDEGLRRGVFEIQPHRAWTHVNWDLDSPPGPYWNGGVEGMMANPDWYQETLDGIRKQPVPSNDMLFLYKTGRDAVEKQFGVTPLATTVRPEDKLYGDGYGRLAAVAGYGVGRYQYIGFDYLIQLNMMEPELLGCHDIDLVPKTDSEIIAAVEKDWPWPDELKQKLKAARIVGTKNPDLDFTKTDWIESRKNKKWMGYNELCAYLHSGVDACPKDGWTMMLNYDAHYCKYFARKPSRWTLEVSDGLRQKLGREAAIRIDGKKVKTVLGATQVLDIPAGIGMHKVQIVTSGKENK
jgi:hypothetical protein